jgi:hypothetical protein
MFAAIFTCVSILLMLTSGGCVESAYTQYPHDRFRSDNAPAATANAAEEVKSYMKWVPVLMFQILAVSMLILASVLRIESRITNPPSPPPLPGPPLN